MTAPGEVVELVERFDRNLDAYRSGHYKETQLRREFIDPFFTALGWDVGNVRGYAEAYKDVIHEDAIRVGGATKAPDYCFRVGGARKFFVEAKKPSVDIRGEVGPAYQLRRYAWSAKLPLSILTDFEELAVYDCRFKPSKRDKPDRGRTRYLRFEQYLDEWDGIADVFSRAAVLKGSFDRYVQETKRKRGTAEVDAAFLKEIERWREMLAKDIAARNGRLTVRELNFSVQRTIDRIIFLRICEDRGIEQYGRLMSVSSGSRVYGRLIELFHRADERYNSGLFHFDKEKGRPETPDELTPRLKVDDKPLKDIISNLYYPESPYEFSVLPADILGHIYEQFLGKVIRLTKGHRAKVEHKPEVRKAGGVYYTPTYIVDYIVKNTVGKLLEKKTPRTASKLRILDPACGSGSFLLGAYQYLLDWHRDWYAAHDAKKHARAKRIYEARGGWMLTAKERKRILLNNIYGVDIDTQAVEVTKLSLLLKVLEGASSETVENQLRLFHERALPDLGSNVKCGNSLIGPDFYEGRLLAADEEERYRINAFDWEAEFPEVFPSPRPSPTGRGRKGEGGFDAVIGNPPYVRIQTMKEWAPIEVEFYKRRYVAASKGNYDIYVVFVERGLGLLNRRGRLGFILPHKFFNAKYGNPLRSIISKGKHLCHVVHFGDQQVFQGATTYTCLLFLSKKPNAKFEYVKVARLDSWRTSGESVEGRVPAGKASSAEWNFMVGKAAKLFERLGRMPVRLGDVAERIYQGAITGADSVYLFKSSELEKKTTEVFSAQLQSCVSLESAILKRVVRSGSIGRYWAQPTALVLFPYEVHGESARLISPGEMERSYPRSWSYLNRNKSILQGREKGKFRDRKWYRFGRTQNLGMWERRKLMIPYMVTRLASYVDQVDSYYLINVTTGGYGITSDESSGSLSYLCGLLNSRLLNFYLKQVSTTFHGGYFAANKQYIEQLPIRPADISVPGDKARHDQMVQLVQRMLDLHKQLPKARTAHDKELIQRRIDATDKKIDRLVYELYGLTEKEIKIVEEATR